MTDEAARDTFVYQSCLVGVAVSRLLLELARAMPTPIPGRERLIGAAHERLLTATIERDETLRLLTG